MNEPIDIVSYMNRESGPDEPPLRFLTLIGRATAKGIGRAAERITRETDRKLAERDRRIAALERSESEVTRAIWGSAAKVVKEQVDSLILALAAKDARIDQLAAHVSDLERRLRSAGALP